MVSNRKIRALKVLLKGFTTLLILAGCSGYATAQNFFLPVDNLSILRLERGNVPSQSRVHFGHKPVLNQFANISGVEGLAPDTATYYYNLTEKIFSEHLIELRKPGFRLNADLIFDFAYGRELISSEEEENSLYTNTRGFSVS